MPPSVWLLVLFVVAAVFYIGIATGGFNLPLERLPWSILVPTMAGFGFLHSLILLGWPRAVVLLILCVTISFCFEYVGQRTGAIFGPYYYTDLFHPKLFGRIPVIIPFAWYMMFYPSYVLTNVLTEGSPIPSKGNIAWIAWMAALSALVMTAWDLTMDPIMSFFPCSGGSIANCVPTTLLETKVGDPAWVWEHGGEHFGVPLMNYRGWLLTAFVVFMVYRSLEPHLPARPWRGTHSRVMAWLPVGAYGALAAVDTWLGYPQIADIHLISPFAMGIPFFFASVQILINRSDLPFWPFGSAARAELERANG